MVMMVMIRHTASLSVVIIGVSVVHRSLGRSTVASTSSSEILHPGLTLSFESLQFLFLSHQSFSFQSLPLSFELENLLFLPFELLPLLLQLQSFSFELFFLLPSPPLLFSPPPFLLLFSSSLSFPSPSFLFSFLLLGSFVPNLCKGHDSRLGGSIISPGRNRSLSHVISSLRSASSVIGFSASSWSTVRSFVISSVILFVVLTTWSILRGGRS